MRSRSITPLARRRRAGRNARLTLAAALLPGVTACEAPPIDWTARRVVPVSSPAVAIDATGDVRPDSLALRAGALTPPSAACPGSLALARSGAMLQAVWWSVRADSSARLVSARTGDGGAHWTSTVTVDSTDRGVTGCRRSAPSIAADAASGYVHVSYAMEAAEGPGIFFAHSMDGGASFHSPVAIVYGERPGRTRIAADGDVVAVAFEQPDEAVPRVGLALSRSMGHIFERRLMPVSDGQGAAIRPVVSVRGRRIAVGWEQRATDTSRTVLVVRAGTLR